MFKRKLSKSDPKYAKKLDELLNDPEYMAKSAKRSEDFERMLNTPMRWYHKLPYWVIIGLILYGIGKFVGVL